MALILDGTNGLSTTGETDLMPNGTIQEEDLGFTIQAFPAGTAMLFSQTSAPTGWTKSTAHNNKALRLVSGTAGSGGSAAFTTAFGTPAVSGSVSVSLSGSVGATTLSVAQMPSHNHSANAHASGGGGTTRFGRGGAQFQNYGSVNTTSKGSNSSHTHSWSGSGSGSLSAATAAIDVAYVDAIIAVKD